MGHSNMTWLDYHYLRFSSVKNPKSFTILFFEFKIANALNLCCFIVECNQVLILLAIENDLSGVVGSLANTIFTMAMTFFIKSLTFIERALRIDKTSSNKLHFHF